MSTNKPDSFSLIYHITNFFIKLLRLPHHKDQLIMLLKEAEKKQLIDTEALTMIECALYVSELQARDIMIPQSQMVSLDKSQNTETILQLVINSAHSRFPVYNEEKDAVLGILHAKDLLACAQEKDFSHLDITEIIRPAVIVPESKHINTLLNEFRSQRYHMAIVADEYGNIAGLVTIEDVLEQIVGEIEDEHDIEGESNIKRSSNEQYIVKALTPIEDFNEYFDCNLSDDNFDTIGGLIMEKFARMPKSGEKIILDKFEIKVLHADSRRIRILEVIKLRDE